MKVDLRKILDAKAPKVSRWTPNFVVRWLERLIRVERVNYVLENYGTQSPMDFIDSTLKYLGISYQIHGSENLKDRRYIFAANHPLGGLDGMALAKGLSQVSQQEVRVLVNDVLMNVEPLRTMFVPINKYGLQNSQYARLQREMYAGNRNVVTFPSGLCSRLIDGRVQDLPWRTNFVQKAKEYQREIIPVFVSGRNSMSFYNFARWRRKIGIKIGVELMLLPREMFEYGEKDGLPKHLDIFLGEAITVDDSKSAAQWTQIIRNKCYELNPSKS